ncbi:collagen alpha chain-like [Dasypus novemcinctus]|uniref:collagen alpha chain-like n=1 Tax=Dasypus novemcinctus TaxID=9361 RepID=UPI00265EBBEB|nr:collagen alpha-1(I) chain-like [Dasypus novemcinctus]
MGVGAEIQNLGLETDTRTLGPPVGGEVGGGRGGGRGQPTTRAGWGGSPASARPVWGSPVGLGEIPEIQAQTLGLTRAAAASGGEDVPGSTTWGQRSQWGTAPRAPSQSRPCGAARARRLGQSSTHGCPCEGWLDGAAVRAQLSRVGTPEPRPPGQPGSSQPFPPGPERGRVRTQLFALSHLRGGAWATSHTRNFCNSEGVQWPQERGARAVPAAPPANCASSRPRGHQPLPPRAALCPVPRGRSTRALPLARGRSTLGPPGRAPGSRALSQQHLARSRGSPVRRGCWGHEGRAYKPQRGPSTPPPWEQDRGCASLRENVDLPPPPDGLRPEVPAPGHLVHPGSPAGAGRRRGQKPTRPAPWDQGTGTISGDSGPRKRAEQALAPCGSLSPARGRVVVVSAWPEPARKAHPQAGPAGGRWRLLMASLQELAQVRLSPGVQLHPVSTGLPVAARARATADERASQCDGGSQRGHSRELRVFRKPAESGKGSSGFPGAGEGGGR